MYDCKRLPCVFMCACILLFTESIILSVNSVITDTIGSSYFSIFRKQILCCCWSLCNPKSGACVLPCHMLFRSSAFLLHQAETKWFSSLQLVAGCSWINWNDFWEESWRREKRLPRRWERERNLCWFVILTHKKRNKHKVLYCSISSCGYFLFLFFFNVSWP